MYNSFWFTIFKYDSIDWGTDDDEEEEENKTEGDDNSDEEYVPRLCIRYVIIRIL